VEEYQMKPVEIAQHFQDLMEDLGVTILAHKLYSSDEKSHADVLTDSPGLEKLADRFSKEIGVSKGIGFPYEETGCNELNTMHWIDVDGVYTLNAYAQIPESE
jgi:quinolinate synthase